MKIPSLAKAKVSIVAETTKFNKSLGKVKKDIQAVAVTTVKTTKTINKAWDATAKHIGKATSHLTGMHQQLIGLGAIYFGKRLAADFIDVAASFEAMEVQLDVLTKGRGKETLHELNQWALDMPVNTQKAVDSFRLMTAMGLDPTIKSLETLTDVASIFGDDVLQRLALQLGQASAKGKIMAQDLNIMAEAGINARKYLKDAYGMTVEEIQRSGIDIKDIVGTIFKGMEEDFGGSAKKMMTSWRGLKTVSKSYFVEIERSIMAAGVFDELKNALSLFNTEMKSWLESNRELIKQDVPKYIEKFKNVAKTLWDVLTYDPAILEYGMFGLLIGGRKGAVALGSLAHMHTWLMNISAAMALASTGSVDFTDVASANFKELEKIVSDFNKEFDKVVGKKENNVVTLNENPFQNEIDRINEVAKAAKRLKIELSALRAPGRDQNAHVLEYYKQLEVSEKRYSRFILDSMDKTSEEYKTKWLEMEMEKWNEDLNLTKEQIEKIKEILKLSFEGKESFFAGVAENFTSAIKSEMSGVFTGLLTDDLDSFEDYFSNFTQSLTQMWGQMAAKMVMTQSMQKVGNFAALGAAGLAIGGVSSFLGDRAEERDRERTERREIAQITERVNTEVSASLAQLELSDLDYQAYQLNERIKDLVESARKAGLPLEDIVKLRKLETKAIIEQASAGYNNLAGNIEDYITGKQRQDWSVADWQREFGVLSDELMSLNTSADDYNDRSLDLLTDQYEILQSIYEVQENQLRALDSTSQSLVAQATGLQTSEGMPISREFFENEYARLLDAALTSEDGMLNTTDIAFFQAFVTDYVDTMSMLGFDHASLINQASSDLLEINDAVQSEMEILAQALTLNTGAVGENTLAIIGQLENLESVITNIANDATFSEWMNLRPEMPQGFFESLEGLDIASANLFTIFNTLPDIVGEMVDDIPGIVVSQLDLFAQDMVAWADLASESVRDTAEWEAFNAWAAALDASTSQEVTTENIREMLELLQNMVSPTDINGGYTATEGYQNAPIIRPDDDRSKRGGGDPVQVNLVVSGKALASILINESRDNPEFARMLS